MITKCYFYDFPRCKNDFPPLIRNFKTDFQRLSHLWEPIEVTDDEKIFKLKVLNRRMTQIVSAFDSLIYVMTTKLGKFIRRHV